MALPPESSRSKRATRDDLVSRDYLLALTRTVPFHVVDAVLRSPTEGSVEHKTFDGTVLFADLVGFTAVCERLARRGPEGLSKISSLLNSLFGRVLDDALFPYDGYIAQFGGDSVTAFFINEGHGPRAAAAALGAQRIMHGEVGRMLDDDTGKLMLRIGLASGRIDLPVLGDLMRRVVVCAGVPAHRALQLQQRAEPSSIVIDATTMQLLGGDAELVDRKPDHAVLRGLRRLPATLPIPDVTPFLDDAVAEKVALLEPFVPQPLALRLRTTPKGWRIEGELRNVVILFSEINGLDRGQKFLEPSVQLSRSMLRAFRRYEGVVAKADITDTGHRLMVLFGLHEPSANDGERALLAALEATARVRTFVATQNIGVSMRTGLHAGRVYFGAIGSDLKHDITVVGDAVNVAARCAAAAGEFEVLATEVVLDPLRGEFETTRQEPLRAKNRAEPLEVLRVHGPAEGRTHFVRRRERQRFIAGRGTEMARVEELVARALDGKGTVLGICGETGTGKSCMLAQIIDRWTEGGGTGVIGRCRFATKATPLAPIVRMFENYLGLTRRDTETQRRERIRQTLADFELDGGAPELVALLQPVRRPDGTTEALIDLADSHAQERVLASITQFIEQRVSREKVLYVVEDLQFADTLTLQLIMRMSSFSRDWPFLFVGTYRPDPVLRDMRRTPDEELTLSPLSLRETNELISHERGAQRVEPDVSLFMWERSGGNPGHLVELLRFLCERELLPVRAGEVVAHGGLEVLRDVVPTSLAHVALAGFSNLGEVERRVLRMASAIGRRFERPLLEQITSSSIETDLLEGAMSTLESHRIIAADDGFNYLFRDDLTRVVAYNTIPESERREVHRRIAEALERLPPSDAARSPSVVAFHRERAGDFAAAAGSYAQAARLAMRASMERECAGLIDSWERAVASLKSDHGPPAKDRAGMLVLKLVAVSRQGYPGESLRLVRELQTKYEAELDKPTRLVVDFWAGEALVAAGRPEKARVRLQRVYDGADSLTLRADAAHVMATSYVQAEALEDALAWIERAELLSRDDGYRMARLGLTHAAALTSAAQLERAREMYRVVHGSSRHRDHMALRALATAGMARCDLLDRRFDVAVEGFAQAARMGCALGRAQVEASCLGRLGETYVWSGAYDLARPYLERAVVIGRDLGDELIVGHALVHLGLVIALTRDPAEGEGLLEDGGKRVERASWSEVVCASALHRAHLAVVGGDRVAAESAVAAALGSVRKVSPLVAHVTETLRARAAAPGVG